MVDTNYIVRTILVNKRIGSSFSASLQKLENLLGKNCDTDTTVKTTILFTIDNTTYIYF